jgi:hypothetical protein
MVIQKKTRPIVYQMKYGAMIQVVGGLIQVVGGLLIDIVIVG